MNRDTIKLVARPDNLTPVEMTKAHLKGWVRVVFWGLRIYILAMIVLVFIGFARGHV